MLVGWVTYLLEGWTLNWAWWRMILLTYRYLHVLLKPLWVDLVTVYLFTSWSFLYFIWWLLKEPFVCVKEKIYSKKCQIQLCNGRILKTSVITICLRELLLYRPHNKCRNDLSSFPLKPSINPPYILMIIFTIEKLINKKIKFCRFCNWVIYEHPYKLSIK